MKRFCLACLAAAALFAEGSGGIPPRPRAADYPVQQTMDGLTLAAATRVQFYCYYNRT